MNVTTATITGSTIVLAEVNDAGLTSWLIGEEARPATFADADTFLAFHGYGRTENWELSGPGVTVTVARIDNLFNGVRAARLDQAVGTTHEEFEYTNACKVENGDLISDGELTEIYVVGGSSTDGDATKIHMIREGKTWDDRYTGHFLPQQLVKVARKR